MATEDIPAKRLIKGNIIRALDQIAVKCEVLRLMTTNNFFKFTLSQSNSSSSGLIGRFKGTTDALRTSLGMAFLMS